MVKESLLIPASKAIPPWDAALDRLQREPFVLILAPAENQEINFQRVETIWQIALHWVFKLKWSSKHKIPYNPKLTKVCKPYGELVFRYLELCIQCHAVYPIGSFPYGNASNWFEQMIREAQLYAFSHNDSPGKVQRLKERREQLNLLKEGKNPFSSKSLPHLHRLIAACLPLLSSDRFDKDYWTPYVKAFSAWNTMFESKEWTTYCEQEGKSYIRMGQGKGLQRLYLKE